MAACPIVSAPPFPPKRKRGPYAVSQRRIEANRRNAARSTGPRTAAGKARVASNPIKHGFFVAQARWTREQRRDFIATYSGLREDFRPRSVGEESCVFTIADSYIRLAAALLYENRAAYEWHQQQDRELDARIALAEPAEAERLRAHREELRAAGLWRPTIPGPREANAIIRYMGRLDRTIRDATSMLEGFRSLRNGNEFRIAKRQKQSHSSAAPSGDRTTSRKGSEVSRAIGQAKANPLGASTSNGPVAPRGTPDPHQIEKTKPFAGVSYQSPEPLPRTASDIEPVENEKTNPFAFAGNRHERRRAMALARRRT